MRGGSLSRCGLTGCVLIAAAASNLRADIASDDFNTCTLNPSVWTLVDPLGGGSANLVGMGTADALLLLSVPAGATHDVWTDGNNAVRLMQPAPNSDFEIQVKFQSQYSAGYQGQGLLVEQDATRFLRFDSFFDGVRPYLYAATFSGATVNVRKQQSVTVGGNVWLSVRRAGNTWTLSYSADGGTWTVFASFSDTFTVSRVGIFASNYAAGPAPAFTARVDSFVNAAAPLTAEDGTPQTPAATLTTHVVGQGTVNVSPQQAAYYCGETVTLTAQPLAGYAFQGWSGDLAGASPQASLTMAQSRVVTATFTSSGAAPAISQVRATPHAADALVQWNTDIPATSTVCYGLTTAYELGAVNDAALSTAHALTITPLTPSQLYHYQVASASGSGESATSADLTFTTTPLQTGIVSDDYNTCSLDARWTVFDQLGGTSVSTVGMGTSDARLRIAIPAGKIHDLWTDDMAAVRVLQAAPNSDFEVQAKFDSALLSNYQFQGIDIEGDATHLVRFDVDYDGARTSLFAATISGSTATIRLDKTITAAVPIWLDVKRAGSLWTLSYSADGNTWSTVASFNFSLAVTRVGPYAGTYASSGSAPAFTCLVDYFMNVAQPLSPEDGPPQTPPATLTSSVVGQGNVSVSPQQSAYYCGETVTITATPSAGWTFQGWSGDLSGSTPQATLVMSRSRAVTATFTTSQPPLIASDDFNACSINPRWTVVDPLGDGAVRAVGVGTSDARLRIDIPAGRSHDLWTNANESIRVLQAATNSDFEVQAKFDSPVNTGYQLQGIVAETDLTHLLRYDVIFDGSRTRIFAATISGSSASVRLDKVIANVSPIVLRMKRAGSNWTLSYSADGANWTSVATFTYAMTVARIGPFAGTYADSGNAPAFSCLVDYFMNTSSPLGNEDGTPPGPGARLVTSVVGQGSVSVAPDEAVYYCGETVTLTAQPAAGWIFAGWSGDASSSTNPLQLAMTANRSVTATFSLLSEVQLLDQSLSVTSTRDGQMLRAGYKLSAPAPTPVTLGAQLVAPDGHVLDDSFRELPFTVTTTPQWFYRDLLVNLAPREGAGWYGMRWDARWGTGGEASHFTYGAVQVQNPVPLRVPILMYHYFGPPIDQYWVTPENFRAQLLALKAHGYTSVTLTDLMNYRAGVGTPPAKPVVITADDGDGSIYTVAFPILADPAVDMKATFFVISSFVNTTDSETTYVTWDQLATMEASGHVDAQSHTRAHAHMTALSPQDLRNELVESRAELQTRLNKEIRFVCWPYGESNIDTQNAARDAGYFAGLAASGGVNQNCAVKFDLLRTKISSTCTTEYDPNHPGDYFLTVIEDPDVVVP